MNLLNFASSVCWRVAARCWIALAFVASVVSLGAAVNGTFNVTETWSVRLEYDRFGGNNFTGTRTFSGTQSGTIRIVDGSYQIEDRTGIGWSSPGRDLKSRSLTASGGSYCIRGDYPFGVVIAAQPYGLIFLGCFVVKVPLVGGELPVFTRFDEISGCGSSLSSIGCSGNMTGVSLEVYVSSTVSLREVVGPPQILDQPDNLDRFVGQSATFNVLAGGKSPLAYSWNKGSTPLPGANGPTLTLANLQLSDSGNYSVTVSNAGGKVTSAAARLTVRLPPPPWFESWESTPAGAYIPASSATTFINGDGGRWALDDTVSAFPECAPNGNRGIVTVDSGRKVLRLVSTLNSGGCAENVWVVTGGPILGSLAIPLLPVTAISFREAGLMENPQWNGLFGCITPPCGDTTHLRVVDDRNNHVVYVFQRAPNYVEHALTNGPSNFGYREIFLDPAGGVFSRNLYSDLASIAGSAGVGATVSAVEFVLGAAGWAEVDEIRIGALTGTSDQTPPTVAFTAPPDKARIFQPTVTVTGTARDNVAVERVEFRVSGGPYQDAAGTANWSAQVNLTPGTNIVRARARDTSGNYSAEAVRTIFYVVTNSLELIVCPGGKVVGATNGQILELGRSYTVTAMPAPGFVFSNWTGGLTSSAARLTFVMTSNLVLRACFFDPTPPTVVFTAPPDKARIFQPKVTVTGTARDNAAVERVELRVGDGPYQDAVGTTNWSAEASLSTGTNVLRARARDTSGNYSAEAVRTIIHVVTNSLELIVCPGGKVVGATNGQILELGRSYTMTAIPDPGFVFSNWTGGLISSTSRLRFVMTSNLVLKANFVTNPFLPVAGAFNGLYLVPTNAQHESSGFFQCTLRTDGSFSALLRNGLRRHPFTGRFSLEGKATNRVTRASDTPLTVELCLKLDDSGEITGQVTDGIWVAELLADRAVFNARSNPATNFAGSYTMLIPGGTNSATVPAGDGFATITITRAGIATFRNTLADGAVATTTTPISRNGDLPWYLPLYGGRGSALGWLRVLPASDLDLSGEIVWFKPPQAQPVSYTNGFAATSLATGSRYMPFGTNKLFNAESAFIGFLEGGLAAPFTNTVALGPSGRVTNASPNKLTFRVVPTTGLFSGSVFPPGAVTPIAFKGALLQRQGYGGGYFTNAAQSGRVRIAP